MSDDVIYGGLLVLSIPLGHAVKTLAGYHRQRKQLVSTLCGVLIVISVSGFHALHSVLSTLVNCLLVKFIGPRFCHIASFIWCFGYILFFRTTTYFGLPTIPPHANAIQLLLTLKLVGMAFEVHDTYEIQQKEATVMQKEEKASLALQREFQQVNDSMKDMVSYCYCYIGILTGPYYKYRTYLDWLNDKNSSNINTLTPLIHKLKWVPFFAICFAFLSRFFSIKYVQTDLFYEEPFWYRLFYGTPMFTIFRLRFYCAWYLAESMCITATLGAYPSVSKPMIGKGPSDYKALKSCEKMAPEGISYNFETIYNVNAYICDFGPTCRSGMRFWNMTIQYWLANIVHRRVPFRSSTARMAATIFVSAFWHGIYSGYYLGFFSVFPCLLAEDLLAAAFMQGKSPGQQRVVDAIRWFIRSRSFDYMSMAFHLLNIQDIYRYWASVYFIGHIWPIVFIAIGYMYAPQKGAARRENGEKKLKEKDT